MKISVCVEAPESNEWDECSPLSEEQIELIHYRATDFLPQSGGMQHEDGTQTDFFLEIMDVESVDYG